MSYGSSQVRGVHMMKCFNHGGYTVFEDSRGLIGLMDVAYQTGITPAIGPTDVWLALVRGMGPYCKSLLARPEAKAFVRPKEEMTLNLSVQEPLPPFVVEGPAQAIEAHLINKLAPKGLYPNHLFASNFEPGYPSDPGFADLSIFCTVGFHGEPSPSPFNRVTLRPRGTKGIGKILLRGTQSDWKTIYDTFSGWEDFGVVGWMDHVLLNLDFFVEASDSASSRLVSVEDLYAPVGDEPDEALVSGWVNHFYPFIPNSPSDDYNPYLSDDPKMVENRYFLGAGMSRLYFPSVTEKGEKTQFCLTAGSNGWFYDCISDTVGLSYGWTCEGGV